MTRAQRGQRLDQALVDRGLARSRTLAREYIESSRVRHNGTVAAKVSAPVRDDDQLELIGEPERYVGRAAYKLLGALDAFPEVTVDGRRCLDVGASTGGFTQVLLERGAAQVVALDVGHGQLAEPVRGDPRVVERSGTSIRDVTVQDLGGAFGVVVADLSFISLTIVMSVLASMVAADGDAVVLVKPQFEVGRERLGSDGIVRSAQQRAEAVGAVIDAAEQSGLSVHGVTISAVAGAHGNQEYLLWLRQATEGRMDPARVASALATIRTSDERGPR
ncbi:23S rRNA (cytidine1920-2'-O)/16S rRNA (cytidine1409-2'-O)-methyltransferase [Branchiibius hedensis]|uniref:23S rRNA (Cytidine1920-2'-O)/16S rRNA (Cytidine1409-2'-O)-methyltransferase n=1 Tax=Branchiibius hedensis TaxID=672460 RepID=A0A2Y8ZWD0_9MICO|nr:TlyA family RNA methyltransferase [Branchiibius hedensis]PWJ25384.1 23S rRNA (cytidine1920-2'-O)/16S rRNA (cytidine1409-2'-O)-methyltransferase [Branchiibius hedensis]SSA34197.1 23S rRNA (cytidine1920-2'-O)/16S rRNA (cytidine1409-2'-O)-methyltransferase [Branchiibius hedensis]